MEAPSSLWNIPHPLKPLWKETICSHAPGGVSVHPTGHLHTFNDISTGDCLKTQWERCWFGKCFPLTRLPKQTKRWFVFCMSCIQSVCECNTCTGLKLFKRCCSVDANISSQANALYDKGGTLGMYAGLGCNITSEPSGANRMHKRLTEHIYVYAFYWT